jgi:hypothetical protein
MTRLRELEQLSIERFLQRHVKKLGGQVLDIGCGKQPYRHLVKSSGGKYHGYDRPNHPGSVVSEPVGEYWDIHPVVDTVMMTQVWQYVPPWVLLDMLTMLGSGDWSLKPGGWLLATGPTNWPHSEPGDLWRLTPTGVVSLLEAARFTEIEVEPRYSIEAEEREWVVGWAACARSRS